MYSVGVDIGGTFTDVTIVDEDSGVTWTAKTRSTPGDPSLGLVTGLRRAISDAGADLESVRRVVHGTTVATNAIVERKPTSLALVTTAGFRSVLEIGRHDVPPGESYYGWVKPVRPVTPERIFEVRERVGVDGDVLQPLDEACCRAVALEIAGLRVESVAVCFLYSFLHPAHERRAAEIIRSICPDVWVSLSSEVLPQFREYERSVATVLNAYVTPHVSRYLDALGARLTEAVTHDVSLLIMKSSGGVIGAPTAARQAIHTALSGPAAGVIGAAQTAREAGLDDIITIDVGGTSADVSLVRGGQPMLTTSGTIGDFPLQLPIIDIHTIGAGGGSIAHVDSTGRLSVGPSSAGAEPGPVCYGRGALVPTVTDAHLVLGRIPASLLNGEIGLDRSAAERAIRACVAEPLGLGLEAAAEGILAIVNANMAGAIRLVSIERGHDPRRFTLVAFGGAGPLHALELARLLGIPRVLVPRTPGVLSTYGLLNADLRNDFVRTRVWTGPNYPIDRVQQVFSELESEAWRSLETEGVASTAENLTRSADLRYRGQGFELRVEVPGGEIGTETLRKVEADFHAAHEALYSYALSSAPVELVNLRVTATAPLPHARVVEVVPQIGPVERAQVAIREVYFGGRHGWLEAACFNRGELGAGAVVSGPAVLQQLDSTSVLAPTDTGRIDRFGNLIVDVVGDPAR
ncbi:MAG TPA: hydantoinase/oxoprolinase family protein [Chloroflexota bacterium]